MRQCVPIKDVGFFDLSNARSLRSGLTVGQTIKAYYREYVKRPNSWDHERLLRLTYIYESEANAAQRRSK